MAKESLRHRVFKDSFWNFSATIISRFGGLIFTIILARFLLPEGFGIYSLATSVALMFLTFADLGINQAMIRFVSSEIEKNKKKAAAYFRYILKIKIGISLLMALILLASAYILSNSLFHKPELFILLVFLSFYILILAIESFFESTFYVENRVGYITLKEFVFQISRILLALAVFFMIVKSYQLLGIIITLIISISLVSIFVFYYSKKIFSFLFQKTDAEIDKKRVFQFVSYLTITNISLIFFSYIDTLLLGIFVSAEYIGYYRAAFALILSLMSLLAFTNVFLPVLARVEKKKIIATFNKIIRYSMILAIPAAVGTIFLSRYILRFVYGYEYLPAVIPLCVLSPLIILSTIIGDMQTLFSARGKPEKFIKLILIVTFVNILFNLVFIKVLLSYSELYAIIGASLAILCSWIIYFIGAIRLTKREFNLSLDWKELSKPIFASLVMSLVLIGFSSYISDMNIIWGAVEIILGVITYMSVMLIIKGVNSEDLDLIKTLLNKLRNQFFFSNK